MRITQAIHIAALLLASTAMSRAGTTYTVYYIPPAVTGLPGISDSYVQVWVWTDEPVAGADVTVTAPNGEQQMRQITFNEHGFGIAAFVGVPAIVGEPDVRLLQHVRANIPSHN